MKKRMLFLSLALSSLIAMAEGPNFSLDKVVFQLTSKQWVSTNTALVAAEINASLNQSDLSRARAEIMDKLGKIAKADWHIVQFNRSQDSSGLEKLFVAAQARVAQNNLNDVYQNAKNVSSPGATYTITDIEFKPSLPEIEQAKIQLRSTIYQMINDEISRLNKMYPSQSYTLNHLYLTEGELPVVNPLTREKQVMALAAAAPNLSVSNEITMHAFVEVANSRNKEVSVANPQ